MLRSILVLFVMGIGGFLFLRTHLIAQNASNPQDKKKTDTLSQDSRESLAPKDSLDPIRESWLHQIHSKSKKRSQKKDSLSNAKKQTERGNVNEHSDPVHLTNPEKSSDEKIYQEEKSNTIPDNNTKNAREEQSLTTQGFSSVIFRFVGLISVLLLVFYLGMRFLRSRVPFLKGNELVQILASVPLVPGKFLQIVDVGGQILLLGVSDQGVQLLMNVQDGVTADRIRLWQSQSKPEGKEPSSGILTRWISSLKETDFRFWSSRENQQSFSQILGRFTNQKKGAFSSPSDSLNYIFSQQKKHLSKMKLPNTPNNPKDTSS